MVHENQTFWIGVKTPDGKFVKMPVVGLWIFRRKDFLENDEAAEVRREGRLIEIDVKDKRSTFVRDEKGKMIS